MVRIDRSARGRIAALDIARTAALLGMVVFHVTLDLEIFGLVLPGTTQAGGWPLFARAVAGSFLFLAGVSLWLAHGRGIRWRAFLRRLAVIAAAAAVVSLATYIALPGAFVFFGILHSIAAASVIGLAFLRLPVALTIAAAGVAFATPYLVRLAAFDTPWLWWTGLSPGVPPTVDFEPVLPWVAPCLMGIVAARLAEGSGLLVRQRAPGRLTAWLAWPGRHSLAIYLAHQPVLLSLLWGATQLVR